MSYIIDQILNEVCLDDRIPDGIFDMSNPLHMEALLENLTSEQKIPVNDARSIHNKMLEGKYPERQAFNRDGLLVTFPTPQHKQRAMQRGTHFEKDPTLGKTGMFNGQPGQPGQPATPAVPSAPASEPEQEPAAQEPEPNIFQKPAAPASAVSSPAPAAPPQGAQGEPPSALPASDAPAQPSPVVPKGGSSAQSSLPPSDQQASSSDNQGLEVEPPATTPGQPSKEAPAPPPNFDTKKTPQERAAEAEVVKQIMGGDNTNQTLPNPQPKMPNQMEEVERFCEERKLHEALNVIRSMRSMGDIIGKMAKKQ